MKSLDVQDLCSEHLSWNAHLVTATSFLRRIDYKITWRALWSTGGDAVSDVRFVYVRLGKELGWA